MFFYSIVPLLIEFEEQKKLHTFFEKTKDSYSLLDTHSKKDYWMVLEIPRISLKRGIFPLNSSQNTVSKNIELLKRSTSLKEKNSKIFLAAHSGNSRVSYFRNLSTLQIGDIIYLYFEGIKYIYQVTKIYYEKKKGFIFDPIFAPSLVLTTCFKEDLQLVVLSIQVSKEPYSTL